MPEVEFIKPWSYSANGHTVTKAKPGEVHSLPEKLAQAAQSKGLCKVIGAKVETKAKAEVPMPPENVDKTEGALEPKPKPKLGRKRKARSEVSD